MLYMLDTNIVRHYVRAHPEVDKKIVSKNIEDLCISVVTKAELLFGLHRKQNSSRLKATVLEFIDMVTCLEWDNRAAEQYAFSRTALEKQGLSLAPIDLLIASQALSIGATLISNDSAFRQVDGLNLEDWTKA